MAIRRKFNNVKCTDEGGNVFDSKIELSHYQSLRNVFGDKVEHHPEAIVLQEAVIIEGITIRKITYEPDFVIKGDKYKYVVDTKGFETEVFKLKRKLCHGKGVCVLLAKKNWQLALLIRGIKNDVPPSILWKALEGYKVDLNKYFKEGKATTKDGDICI